MVVLDVVYGFPEERADEAETHLRALVAASRREPGCLAYDVFRSDDAAATFLIHERYADDAALEAHRASAHYAEHGKNGVQPIAIRRDVGTYRPLGDA